MTAVDVCIVGDGPAGAALAAACVRRNLSVHLLGSGMPWAATYGVWADELDDVEGIPPHPFVTAPQPAVVWTDRHHDLGRAYAALDNVVVRAHLLAGVPAHAARAASVEHLTDRSRVIVSSGPPVEAHLVVDATGWPPAIAAKTRSRRPPAYQAAFGVVVDVPPPGVDREVATLMDWRPAPGHEREPEATFLYVVDLGARGVLCEETSLAHRPAVPHELLQQRLIARFGGQLPSSAPVETLTIPMGVAVPRRNDRTVAFGAAAGYVHPATGYSVATSLRAAPRVASVIAAGVAARLAPRQLADLVRRAVWPSAMRVTRTLHDGGLEALVRMDGASTSAFFETFFALPRQSWSAYLRADAAPRDVARAMAAAFSAAPPPVRRRLALSLLRR